MNAPDAPNVPLAHRDSSGSKQRWHLRVKLVSHHVEDNIVEVFATKICIPAKATHLCDAAENDHQGRTEWVAGSHRRGSSANAE